MREPIRLFAGYEPLEALGFFVFAHSVFSRASRPVAMTPLTANGLPHGSNSFTLSRFLVPALCNFRGRAIFADASDMLMEEDVAKLDDLFNPLFAVQLVKHPKYKTRHPVKYRGTELECENRDYDRKNWASLMLINCEHRAWVGMTPEVIASKPPLHWLQFERFPEESIGEIPACWNVLADEGHETEGAKVLHWSSGIPCFNEYLNAPASRDWWKEYRAMCKANQEAQHGNP